MNKTLLTLITISLFFISLTGCGNNNSDATNKSTNQSAEASPKEEGQLDNDLLGRYHGIQPSYFLKNQYGDDMVINGNKVSVPSIDFKFLLKEAVEMGYYDPIDYSKSPFLYCGKVKVTNNPYY